MKVHLNESVSQVNTFAINENEEDEEDIYDKSVNASSGNDSEFHSRNSKVYLIIIYLAHCLFLLTEHFKMILKTLNEEKRFLKIFIIRVIQVKYQDTMTRIYIQIRG